MKFYLFDSHDPYYNLALEEYLFRRGEGDIFILWQNEPSVILGKNQNAYLELDGELAEKCGIHTVRRITGGGAVYHDLGNVNYSFISDKRGGIDFEYFSSPIISALLSLGVKVSLSGRNDLVSEGGFKVSGNAQCSADGRVLHHGTLLFDTDLTMLSRVLKPDEEKLREKSIASVRSRVCNIRELMAEKIDTPSFIERLSDFVTGELGAVRCEAPCTEEIDRLCLRNRSREWIYPERDYVALYTVSRRRRYPYGVVECRMEMKNDYIKTLHLYGDFFGEGDVSEIERALSGTELSRVEAVLTAFDVGRYVFGMTSAELLGLVLGKEEIANVSHSGS